MNRNFDEAALMRELLLTAAAEEYQALPETAPQITPAYRKKFARMQADPFGYAAGLAEPRRRWQWAAVAAVLLLAVIGGAIFAIPQTRTIAINMPTKFYQDHAGLTFYGESDELAILPEITFGYIPDGYELYFEDKSLDIRLWQEYVNAADEHLYISVDVNQGEHSVYIDTEHHELSEVKLANDVTAQLFTGEEPGVSDILIWSSADGRLLFDIAARHLPPDELIKIANAISIGE